MITVPLDPPPRCAVCGASLGPAADVVGFCDRDGHAVVVHRAWRDCFTHLTGLTWKQIGDKLYATTERSERR